MSAAFSLPRSPSRRREPVLPLENGDRLTREEFELRYHAMPYLKKAELIRGVVYVPSPARIRKHGKQHGYITIWLGTYASHTPGIEFAPTTTTRLYKDSEPQPDGLLRIEPECGGQSRTSDDDYVEGAPELAAEVSASSVSYDLHDKLKLFQEAGVREYIVWRVLDEEIDWFVRRGKRFSKMAGSGGLLKSTVFPGLWLDVAAMLRGDMITVLKRLQEGLDSPDHVAFVKKLAKKKQQRGKS
jgi:Uma2 family endonuclease